MQSALAAGSSRLGSSRLQGAASPAAPAAAAAAALQRRRLGGGLQQRRQLGQQQQLGKQQLRQQRQRLAPCRVWPFDVAWGVDVNSLADTVAPNLFAASLFPYLGFLYHLTRSKQAPPMTLFGFYFLLAFVFATIPAGIYAKVAYGTALANVDWLHGGAESLLTVTNLLIVLGLRNAIKKAEAENTAKAAAEGEAGGGGGAGEGRQPAAPRE